jgi:hypothetical protein
LEFFVFYHCFSADDSIEKADKPSVRSQIIMRLSDPEERKRRNEWIRNDHAAAVAPQTV